MKIAFLNLYQGKVNRGAETFVYELSRRLSKNHKVDVIAGNALPKSRWPVLWRAFLDPQGVGVALFTIKNLPSIWREKYDIVVPLNGGWQPAFIRLIAWVYGGKMVISGQSGKGWDDRNNLWCFPDAFVALSSFLQRWAKGANPFLRRVEYIPNGVDINKFKADGEKISTKLTKPLILSVGALSEDKRMDLVIKAVAKLRNASLLLVGKGPLKEELGELGRKLLGERFQIVSFDFSEMPKVYRAADVFTLPSPWYRSFEIVLVEAMATNLPVVANNDAIRKEIVGDAGILVDPTNAEAYAKALEGALNKKWGDAPRKQAEKFDWDKIAMKYEELFSSFVK
ncbi:glycosyltransferase family 4 protein [Patescibacteria group bacterium]|nr:glycosyltransferase family 4 protein [Patescibacteria group bacterium]